MPQELELTAAEKAAQAQFEARASLPRNDDGGGDELESPGPDGLTDSDEQNIAKLEKQLASGDFSAKSGDDDEDDAPEAKPVLRGRPVSAPKGAKAEHPAGDEVDELGTPSRTKAPAKVKDDTDPDEDAALEALADEFEPQPADDEDTEELEDEPAPTPQAKAKPQAKQPAADATKVDLSDLAAALDGIKEEVSTEGYKHFEVVVREAAQSRKIIAGLNARLDKLEQGVQTVDSRVKAEAKIPELKAFHNELNTLNPARFGTIKDFDRARQAALSGKRDAVGISRGQVAARQFVYGRRETYIQAGNSPEKALARAVEDLDEKLGVKSKKPAQPVRSHAPAKNSAQPRANQQRRDNAGRFNAPADTQEEAVKRIASTLGIPE